MQVEKHCSSLTTMIESKSVIHNHNSLLCHFLSKPQRATAERQKSRRLQIPSWTVVLPWQCLPSFAGLLLVTWKKYIAWTTNTQKKPFSLLSFLGIINNNIYNVFLLWKGGIPTLPEFFTVFKWQLCRSKVVLKASGNPNHQKLS